MIMQAKLFTQKLIYKIKNVALGLKLPQLLIPATTLLATALISGLFLVFPASAQESNIQDNLCKGANFSTNDGGCGVDLDSSTDQVSRIIANGINLFSLIIGVIAVVMIMVGGVKYITSQGDSGNVTAAKNTILYAVIGLVVVALAQVIVRFVLNQAVSVSEG